jgi:DNA-binding LytR/AlgR family response regulator
MKIGICDDERIILDLLSDMVRTCLTNLDLSGDVITMQSGSELLEVASELDAVFLDVEMPELDGIETGRMLKRINPNCHIILATSKTEYYKDGFKIDALRYITKPFEQDEIIEALEAVQKSRIGMDIIQLYDNRTLVEVKHREIEYITAYDSFVEVIIKNRVLRTKMTLIELEEILDRRIFFRIHRKCLVNMLKIQSYKERVVTIENEKLVVSRRKKKEFEKAYIECDLNYK